MIFRLLYHKKDLLHLKVLQHTHSIKRTLAKYSLKNILILEVL
jgi:hypothetical protein